MAKSEKHATLADLKTDPQNARKHNPRNIGMIEASLRQVGAARSGVIDEDGTILAGNGTFEALAAAGINKVKIVEADGEEWVVVRRRGLTVEQKRALAIADNRASDLAEWDGPMLAAQGIDLAPWFSEEELRKIGGATQNEQTPPDPNYAQAEELKEHYGVTAGQIWQLGQGRLMCGDSTSQEDVEQLMDGKKASLCFTSPPYAQQRNYKPGNRILEWDSLMREAFGNLPMAENSQIFVNLGLVHHNGEWLSYWIRWTEWMRAQKWRCFAWYVWDQGWGLPGDWNGRFAPCFEFIFHFNKISIQPHKCVDKKPDNMRWRGRSTMRRKDGVCKPFTSPEASIQPNKIPDSVIRINRMYGGHDIDHPAIFPVELPMFFAKSWDGDLYEPFSGSGTTLIACEQLNRRSYAMEISPAYVAVSIQRWVDLTGKEPKLLNG